MDNEILTKIYKYCAYQDRCRMEIVNKLRDIGLEEKEKQEEMLAHLSAERFWDEERFARNFARGKFRVKKWGRQKIRRELQLKGLNESLISKALKSEIDEESYRETLGQLMEKKLRDYKGSSQQSLKAKLYNFLLQKGYESENIWSELRKIDT